MSCASVTIHRRTAGRDTVGKVIWRCDFLPANMVLYTLDLARSYLSGIPMLCTVIVARLAATWASWKRDSRSCSGCRTGWQQAAQRVLQPACQRGNRLFIRTCEVWWL
ncbi:hypothetical protein BAUCODRAFT_333240 [Baudoinia panamericana UAMH 10762]|uniref:Uncharacterized protein n=1 Tax=Baudoinia panamericana (strain UAMH 10762) TaxID=717646 RepID=M2M3C6_BAUPA|nr:uncharacterized protein BAUCODRAFT_333240 [Baudoinia panamericana UAMH 10762]EMC91021.1 hypothetical protein BAUCODRAFT_333240 [Baudoinia panamericana UAMH 10762]